MDKKDISKLSHEEFSQQVGQLFADALNQGIRENRHKEARRLAALHGAKVGEEFTITVIENEEDIYAVAPVCDKDEGFWACLSHDVAFRTDDELIAHAYLPQQDRHAISWVCVAHGPEVP